MKTATIKQLKDELTHKSTNEIKELCLHLARFKKENKELLTYLLFEAHDEEAYIETIQNEIIAQFSAINTNSYYYIRKSVRKILSQVKKYIRYSKNKETEAALLLFFCKQLKTFHPNYKKSQRLQSVFDMQLKMAKKAMDKLHEDLQYDYQLELDLLLEDA